MMGEKNQLAIYDMITGTESKVPEIFYFKVYTYIKFTDKKMKIKSIRGHRVT